jgi:hypothetical protein
MAWSLVHPELTVVIPRDVVVRRPLGCAMAPGADDLAQFVDQWVVLQQARGNVKRAYDYWILRPRRGGAPTPLVDRERRAGLARECNAPASVGTAIGDARRHARPLRM